MKRSTDVRKLSLLHLKKREGEVSMDSVFSWIHNVFWVIHSDPASCALKTSTQAIHSLQDFIEFRASLNITVQIK